MRKDWWTPLTGVAFVVMAIISFVVAGEPPDADGPVGEIVSHYEDDKDAIQVGALLGMIAVGLLVFFGAILRRALRAAEPAGDEPSVLPNVAFAGAVIFAIGAAIDSTITFALSEGAGELDPAGMQTLQTLYENDFFPVALGIGLLLLASGLSIVRTRALPVALGWVAVVLGVLAFTPVGFVSFLAGALWVIATSVLLTLRRRGPDRTATA